MSQLLDFSWKEEYAKLTEEISKRNYSPNTLKGYQHWVRRFETFTCSKPVRLLAACDVKSFITYLSVELQAPPVTQNQALNALFFFIAMS